MAPTRRPCAHSSVLPLFIHIFPIDIIKQKWRCSSRYRYGGSGSDIKVVYIAGHDLTE